MSKRVYVFDTTLRDGEQTPGVHITPEQKVEIAERLEAFGVATIEAGFPVSSPGDFDAVSRVAQVVRKAEVAAFARCKREDIDAAAAALRGAARPVIHVFIGTSDIHREKKLGMSRADVIRAIERSVAYARGKAEVVQFTPEDASRTERPFLRQCISAAVAEGASRINVADTVGCAIPAEFGAVIRDVAAFVPPGVIVSAHCHNDMGMATANTVAAVESGATQVEVTVNGIGERAGNAAVEEVGVVLAVKGIAETGLDLSHVSALSRRVSEVTGVPVQPNRAVVGANAFAHSAGIHQDGIVKDPRTYESVPPSMVDAAGHQFVLTGRSGRRGVAHQAQSIGCALAADEVEAVYQTVIQASEAKCGPVSDAELAAIIRELRAARVSQV